MKKFALCAIVVAFAAVVQANELWWFVDDEVQVDGTTAGSWDTIGLYASANGSNFGGTLVQSIDRDTMYFGEVSKANIDSYSGYSFYIELINSNERIATSYVSLAGDRGVGAVSYDALKDSIATSTMSQPSVYQFSNFSTQVVPEPTSGLLMLVGLAGLALKRKRA